MSAVSVKSKDFPVQIWERLELVAGSGEREGVYSCRVSDMGQKILYVSRPVFEHGQALLANKRMILVRFTRGDAAYGFSARLCETDPKSTDTMILKNIGDIRRIQRRRFVRIEKIMNLRYFCLARPVTRKQHFGMEMFIKAKSSNISAGGLLFEIEEKVSSGAILLLDLSLSGLGSLPAKIVSIARQARTDDEKRRLVGVEFILNEDLSRHLRISELVLIPDEFKKFDSHAQNYLVSEFFAEQLVLRQKGLL